MNDFNIENAYDNNDIDNFNIGQINDENDNRFTQNNEDNIDKLKKNVNINVYIYKVFQKKFNIFKSFFQ